MNIYQDNHLYGHALVSLPQKLMAFSQGELCLRDHLDDLPVVKQDRVQQFRDNVDLGDFLFVSNDYKVARMIEYRKGTRGSATAEIVILNPVIDLVEFIGRRILGSLVTLASFLTLLPIGFVAKVIHASSRYVTASIASTVIGQKVSRIWNDETLFGHALTSAPSKWFQSTTAPLSWHLRPDGTDKRVHIFFIAKADDLKEKRKEISSHPFKNIAVIYDENKPVSYTSAEYPALTPLKFFEVVYKGAVCVPAVLLTGLISPVGLVAKGVHSIIVSLSSHLRHMERVGQIINGRYWV